MTAPSPSQEVLDRLRRARREELGARGIELRDLLDMVAENHPSDPLLQATIPALVAWAYSKNDLLEPAPAPLGARELRPLLESVRELTRDDPGHPSKLYLAGSAIFQADGTNHLRSAAPIMSALGESSRLPASIRATRRRARRLTKRAVRQADRLLKLAGAQGVGLPAQGAQALYSMLIWAAHLVAYAEAAIAAIRPEAVVVFGTPNIGPRALVHAARAAGVPSVYFPHASVLTDPTLNDLPTDFAGVRGPAEVDYYEEVVGSRDRIEVVGDPSIAPAEMPEHDPSLPPVLAPPLRKDRLTAVIKMVREALDGPVTISPHPRADTELIESLLPHGWKIWADRTYELLKRGPPFLMQWTSGVTLEALSLGIPTIELRVPPGRTITYEMIREPHVRIVSGRDELRRADSECRVVATDRGRRERLCEWARRWSHPRGEEASERGAALIRLASSGPPPGAIWSVWPNPD